MRRRQRGPIHWFGGKGTMTAKLMPLLPPHHIYVEPFGGGPSLLFAKEPAPVEVYNDLDSGLVNFFRVVRDPERCAQLHWKASHTPYSREEWEHCRDTWRDCESSVERAYRWYVVARMSFAGLHGRAWGLARGSSRGRATTVASWQSAHELLAQSCARLSRVQIEHGDWRRVVDLYDTPSTLFYFDPPYISETRRGGGYAHELIDDDHRQIVATLSSLRGQAVLSGYRSDIYAPLEADGWRRVDFEVFCTATGRTRGTGRIGKMTEDDRRVESVWLSPGIKARPRSPRRRKGRSQT